jgi:uncharacterized protein (UPF0332 family)
MMDIHECFEKGYLRKIKPDKELLAKELKESNDDLKTAGENLENGKHKWSIVVGYYSMFHAARALLFSLGYREKKHFAISVVLEELSKKGLLESKYLNYFSSAMEAREGADYSYKYSEDKAEEILEYAQKFVAEMENLITSLRI